ncbi:ATP-binding cassette subfamily B protein [Rhizobium mesoamericanum]|uniref:ABC transporter ATP-binding protein n=1 Tax=Rhizobium mesoamericanum TaxID=1079800 RepID=UPI00278711FA|nr:ABC transporter ATP-binding protein [Rhizobium mesoamericanum]MDQ0564417.1 ATP-binding cassette subfamily B protein [Rhizobium mesoamericanum]
MTRFIFELRGGAFRNVLAFTVRHWTREPARLVIIIAAILVSTVSDVLTPLYSGRLVDAAANATTPSATVWAPILEASFMLIALPLGAVVTRHITFMGINHITVRMMSDVAGDAFHRIQRFSTDWHANHFVGSTVRKISRGMWALDLLNYTVLFDLFQSLIVVIGSTVLLGWNWPIMGLIIGSGSLFYCAHTLALSLGYVAPAASLANSWDTRLGGSLADAISCNAVVRSFGAEAREDERLAAVISKWRHRMRRSCLRWTINVTTQGLTMAALRAVATGYALVLWSRGRTTPGDVALMLSSFFVMQGYLRDLGTHLRTLQRSVNDMEELVDIQGEPLGVADIPGAQPIRITEGCVEFENVCFGYGDHQPLYNDFSISIKGGARVGLVGPSGSGKTTFVKLIQRLYDVNGGRVIIDGQDVSKVTQSSLRSQIAMVQQDPVLFHRSLAENIAYGRPSVSQAEIEEAARLANAHTFIERLPKGYGTLVGERGVKLSGGERQRVAIARAFLANAPLLILDEATSSLDSESEVLIQKAMERLMVGRTTLVIAHRLATVQTLDRLLVFDCGRIIEEGDHAALSRLDGGTYRRLFERQRWI